MHEFKIGMFVYHIPTGKARQFLVIRINEDALRVQEGGMNYTLPMSECEPVFKTPKSLITW